MLKKLKERMLKQVKEDVMAMSHQRKNNVIRAIEISKIASGNSGIKSTITEIK